MSVISLNEKNFEEEVLKAAKPVLIDFWASWCGPCRMMSPVIDKIAEEMGEKVKVCKINIDEEQNLAVKYNVMSIPTFIILKNGKEVARSVGVQDKSEIIGMIEQKNKNFKTYFVRQKVMNYNNFMKIQINIYENQKQKFHICLFVYI